LTSKPPIPLHWQRIQVLMPTSPLCLGMAGLDVLHLVHAYLVRTLTLLWMENMKVTTSARHTRQICIQDSWTLTPSSARVEISALWQWDAAMAMQIVMMVLMRLDVIPLGASLLFCRMRFAASHLSATFSSGVQTAHHAHTLRDDAMESPIVQMDQMNQAAHLVPQA